MLVFKVMWVFVFNMGGWICDFMVCYVDAKVMVLIFGSCRI